MGMLISGRHRSTKIRIQGREDEKFSTLAPADYEIGISMIFRLNFYSCNRAIISNLRFPLRSGR